MSSHWLVVSFVILWEVNCKSYWDFFLYIMLNHYCICPFKIVSVFQHLIMMCFDTDRSHRVCSMLRFWASWMCRLIFFIQFIKFAPVIALVFYYLLVFGRARSFVSVCGLSLVVAHGASQQVTSLVASTGGRHWLQWLQRVRLRPQ